MSTGRPGTRALGSPLEQQAPEEGACSDGGGAPASCAVGSAAAPALGSRIVPQTCARPGLGISTFPSHGLPGVLWRPASILAEHDVLQPRPRCCVCGVFLHLLTRRADPEHGGKGRPPRAAENPRVTRFPQSLATDRLLRTHGLARDRRVVNPYVARVCACPALCSYKETRWRHHGARRNRSVWERARPSALSPRAALCWVARTSPSSGARGARLPSSRRVWGAGPGFPGWAVRRRVAEALASRRLQTAFQGAPFAICARTRDSSGRPGYPARFAVTFVASPILWTGRSDPAWLLLARPY